MLELFRRLPAQSPLLRRRHLSGGLQLGERLVDGTQRDVDHARRIADGDAGPAAQWLTGQLARVQPAAADASLKARIHAFQLAQGLEADGVAGPMTFMQLNRASGVDEPRLTAER